MTTPNRSSKWDLIRLARYGASPVPAGWSAGTGAERAARRTAACDRLLAAADRAESPASRLLEAETSLEIEHRREWWRWRVRGDSPPTSPRNGSSDAVGVVAASLGATAVWLWVGPWGVGSVLLVCLLIGLVAQQRAHTAKWCIYCMSHEICPDCQYPLGQTQIEIGRLPVRCGPPACPECGSPWPLVPPAAPRSDAVFSNAP